MTLEEFLKKIFSLGDGTKKPVYVYDTDCDFPDDEDAELIMMFNSTLVPKCTMSERMCKAEVEEIYWTPEGIAVCVDM